MIREDIYCSLIYNTETQTMNGILNIRDIISLLAFINDKFKLNKDQINSVPFFIKELFNKNITVNTLDIITEEIEKTSSENQSLKSEVFAEGIEIEDDELNKNGLFDQENKCLNHLYNAFSLININDYMNYVKGSSSTDLFTISLDDNLYDCIRELMKIKTHRLVIEDVKTKKYCGFVNYEAVFDFFIEQYYSEMHEFSQKANELNIVSTDLITMRKNDSIYSCFELILKEKISFVPIYDQDSLELFGFVYLKDIIYLFSNSTKFSVSDIIIFLSFIVD